MKKTFTVNLGGVVFHIDEDAYRLLDNYLNNLKQHFGHETGADEIVDDIERRLSELFTEQLTDGRQVITLTDVESVISRMGRPEEMESHDTCRTESATEPASSTESKQTVRRRLFRDPDNKMLGGVASGLSLYLGWDVTLVRLLLFVILIFGYGILIPIYLICWIVIPEARTAADRLSMRGEAVTVENIGRAVTDGFEQVTRSTGNYLRSDRPRSLLHRLGDGLVDVIALLLKAGLVIFAIICSPILFSLALAFVVFLFIAFALLAGGGAALVKLFSMYDVVLPAMPLPTIAMYTAGILMVGLPLFFIVWCIFRTLFNWSPMGQWLRWTLVILWLVSIVVFFICFVQVGCLFPEIGVNE